MSESFNEISRLYARNYSVLEAVKREFLREVDAFLQDVYQEVRSATSDRAQQRITQVGWRYWWIGDKDKDRYPQLSVSGLAPEIVHPGEVKLFATAPRASVDQRRALAAIASRPNPPTSTQLATAQIR